MYKILYFYHTTGRDWYVLLDAASYASTSPLDLSAVKPDFVPISFYKIFGYPTGLGEYLSTLSSTQICIFLKQNRITNC